MIAIILTILFFGFTITIHELGHFITAKRTSTKVNEFSIGMGPSLFHWGKGETKYSIRALPIGGYVAMEGEGEESDDARSYGKRPLSSRMLIIISGALMNIITGFVLVGIIVGVQGKTVVPVVDTVKSDNGYTNPLMSGDRIKNINGIPILSGSDLQFELSRVPQDKDIDLTVVRDGEKITLKNVGYTKTENESTSKALGITLSVEDVNIKNFFGTTFADGVFYAKLVWVSLGDLVTGKVSVSQLSGPVGVAKAVSQAETLGILSVLSLFAFLSINVGLFNLIPFPALDGGQFLLLLIELIFRRPVNKKIQQTINVVGLSFLFLLMIGITIKDIVQLF